MNNSEKTNIWLQIQQALKKRIDKNSYETWFQPTVYIGQETDSLYIKVPNSYFKDWLSFHYSGLINTCCRDLFDKVYDIKYIYDDSSPSFMRRSPQERKSKQGSLLNPNLNPNYTFENFIVGSCNQFAHAAASAVGKNPAKSYNPLYIYGGAGL
jgi:chromosomal replication initiator protein